ncbi:MAG: hypothetical protein K5663_05770 [Clostridiales bacterium]|nr:hypothetical protein [Clostridiales bacterium]
MKKYEAPELIVDSFAPDTMIASLGYTTKNGNPDNNQNCAGCRETYGARDPEDTDNWCNYLPGTAAYDTWC